MRLRTCGLALALAGTTSTRAQEPAGQDEGILVRGAFVTSRPGAKKEEKKEAAAPSPAPSTNSSGAPGNGGGAKLAKQPAGGARTKAPGRKRRPAAKPAEAQIAAARKDGQGAPLALGGRVAEAAHAPAGLGIGYTLFLRGETGEATRVSSGREFRSGESVRLLLETNADAYLYIFNAENDGPPQLIFPSGKLDRGANLIRAHVPREIPSAKEADDRLRWFVFDDRPAVERLYIVVSRRPLAGVPAGEELVALCAERNCAWSPKPEQWAALKRSNEREQIATSQVRDDGRMETPAEREAATRGIGLASDAPLPTVIHMVSSSNADILVATLDLVHK
jgi:hypothetical protein